VIEDADGPFIPYFDHRRALGIANPAARQFVFSMQQIWIRDRIPDLAEARLAIIQFPVGRDSRSIRLSFHSEAELLSYEQLDARVRTIYEAWARVCAEKARDARGTGTGGSTPLGF
jgi:hypothetical protein